MTCRSYRTLVVGLLLAVAATVAGGLAGSPAQAADYRYWTYWWGGTGTWRFAPAGASHQVADGDVEGWRFAVSPVAGARTPPRAMADFERICEGVGAEPGTVRVGLVVDYGLAAAAPPGERPPRGVDSRCITVPAGSSGLQVLGRYTGVVRLQGGLVCGINGYPARECGVAATVPSAAQPSPPATSPPTSAAGSPAAGSGGSSGGRGLPALLAAVIVTTLGGAAVARARRTRGGG